ncbi:MAG TPA: hypothetical protein V6D08_16295 [Candidatus Obscuribacterales bacterium]
MRRISTDCRFVQTALVLRDMAREAMSRTVPEPWHARKILDGALTVLKFSQAPERAEAEVIITADLGEAARLNPTYVDAFINQGAEGLYAHALNQAERNLGKDHPAAAYVIAKRADMYLAQVRLWEADRLYEQVVGLLDRPASPDPELLAHALVKRGDVRLSLGCYAEAEVFYLRGIDLLLENPASDQKLLAHAFRQSADMLEKTGREQHARGLRQRAEEIEAALHR